VKLREIRRVQSNRFTHFYCENICEKVIPTLVYEKAGTIPDMGNIKTLKPFQSGPDPRRNTKGRPKGSKNWRTLFMKILGKEILVGGKKIRVDEAIVQQLVRKAAKGNLRAAEMVIDRVDGKVPETVEISVPSMPPEEIVWTEQELADHEKYFKRNDHGQHQ